MVEGVRVNGKWKDVGRGKRVNKAGVGRCKRMCMDKIVLGDADYSTFYKTDYKMSMRQK